MNDQTYKKVVDIFVDNSPKSLLSKGLVTETRKGMYQKNQEVIIKIITVQNTTEMLDLDEIQLTNFYNQYAKFCQETSCIYLVNALSRQKTKKNFYYAFDKCDQNIFEITQPLKEYEIILLITHISEALKYLENHGSIHGNIKPSNIFRTKKNNEVIFKITDFYGFKSQLTEDQNMYRKTLEKAFLLNQQKFSQYIAPELKKKQKDYSTQSDLFAFGTVCQELIEKAPQTYSRQLKELINKMIQPELALRLKLSELIIIVNKIKNAIQEDKAKFRQISSGNQDLDEIQELIKQKAQSTEQKRKQIEEFEQFTLFLLNNKNDYISYRNRGQLYYLIGQHLQNQISTLEQFDIESPFTNLLILACYYETVIAFQTGLQLCDEKSKLFQILSQESKESYNYFCKCTLIFDEFLKNLELSQILKKEKVLIFKINQLLTSQFINLCFASQEIPQNCKITYLSIRMILQQIFENKVIKRLQLDSSSSRILMKTVNGILVLRKIEYHQQLDKETAIDYKKLYAFINTSGQILQI